MSQAVQVGMALGRPVKVMWPREEDFTHDQYRPMALIKAEAGDRWGNLVYRKAARNFGPVMAMAAKVTIATVHDIVELGSFDPETVVTPGIFVSKIVKVERTITQGGGFKA